MKILVLGAGGPAGANTCRALWAAGHEVYAVDTDSSHLEFITEWATPYTEGNAMDLVIPQPDRTVLELAQMTKPRTFLPKLSTILQCQDKFECGIAWRRAGLRTDRSVLVDSDKTLMPFDFFDFPMWLRARHGAGAKAAIKARTWIEAYHWFNFWRERDPSMDMVLEEVLPGRDFSWASLWYRGELVASFARERLEYLYPGLTPEGLTGTPTRARVVDEPAVNEMAASAVLAIDESPHGIFCVDLKEDSEGDPRPTEINAGRFSTTVGLWSIYQPDSNMVAAAVDLALTGDCDYTPPPEGLTLYRHIDCGHRFVMEPAGVAA